MALIELKTEGTRPPVKINGMEYLLAPYEGFSITEQHRLRKDGLRIEKLMKLADATEEQVQELQAIADGWFNQVAGDIPDDIRKKLLPGQKQDLVGAYFLALMAEQSPPKKTPSKSGRGGGSRHSRGSTRSRPKSG